MAVNPLVEIRDYSLELGKFKLQPINLMIHEREIFGVLGKTGSGKTVLLESIAGFYRGRSGQIYIQGQDIAEVPLEKRGIGFVYQDFGLFPHMTVADNIGYGLRMQKKEKQTIKDEVNRMAEILAISSILKQYPGTLSGGERQRTAIARALILNPRILLLDEPFSSLDPATKETMYRQVKEIHRLFGCTILFVTHDFKEAQSMADRIGIMIKGELKRIRRSTELFVQDSDEEVNRFLGLNRE
ncbi:ABC transporter related [Desulfitobacterium hafniense DCB-2]|uniref:ABC transporter related n=1 Tax=Desulfitobacterium hafniense (strain DSM 10664 / DCB-2) TaxID=272564 RepID=B8FSQ0_DESHD|nr:ATP-binding cassette domain-containing protein [Desulfitobacterium hafniense]ACL20261.1 ABC transporter related [Desulfitobacterium hafniense DCB-2]